MAAHPVLTIFLASPYDTADVRAAAVKIVEAINADPTRRYRIDLRSWDDPARPVPCSFLRNPQHEVVAHAGDPGACDLVIGIFRHAFGTPLPEDEFGKSPDGDAWTGTEWEVTRALQAAARGEVRDVLVFRDVSDYTEPSSLSEDERQRRYAQWQRVRRFFDDCRKSDTREILRGLNEYEGPAAFAAVFDARLKAWIKVWLDGPPATHRPPPADHAGMPVETLTPAQQKLHDILLAHDQPLDDDLVDAVWRDSTVTGIHGYLLSRFGSWCRPAQGELHVRFVNLDLLVDHGPGSEGVRHEAVHRYSSLDALLAAETEADAWVLIGPPGSGKSTLLQQHEMQTARATLRALAEGSPRPELCIWQRLADYPHGAADPQQWLDQQWHALYPRLPPLPELASRFRLRYLLDGINEIQAPDADAYRSAVHSWSRWAATLSQRGERHAAPIFAVRTLEFSEPLAGPNLRVGQGRLGAWTPEQMQQYCTIRLGPRNALWPELAKAANAKLRELCELPFNLHAQCELTEALGRPVTARALLFGGLAWLRLRRAFERHELDAAGLLGDDDRLALAHASYWRDHLLALPDEGTLVPGLDRQAEAMQRASQGAGVSVPKAEVARWFATPRDRDAWLKAVQQLNLAEVQLGGRFRYVHQLWQEFFAARQLCRIEAGDLPDFAPPALKPLDEVLRELAAKDPLPPPGVSGWEETVKLAVQIGDAPARLIGAVKASNVALAGRAAAECIDRLEQDAGGRALLAELRSSLLARSRDAAVDLRLRIEAAEALGAIRDPRYRTGGDGSPGRPRYRVPAPGNWIVVEGGRYRIGSDDGDADERPVQTVTLQRFAIAFAPVTNAEFRCFIEAGGYEDERWWIDETARRWRAEGIRNDERFEFWRPRLAALREDFDAAVARYFAGEAAGYVEGTLRTYAGWTEEEAEARLEASFGARPAREPRFWTDSAFNNPAQPVVGVSLFEAQAYCRWLAGVSGMPVHLPAEAEWEAAVRGKEGRRWPWPGGDDPVPGRINDDAAHLRRTSPVGVFPGGDTLQRLVDASGNVWEWTSSLYTEQLDVDALTSASSDGSARRAVRGGASNVTSVRCRAGIRDRFAPDARSSNLGFRVVCCPIP